MTEVVHRYYTRTDGPAIKATGLAHMKRPNPVYLIQQPTPFTVDTNEGRLRGNAGDYLAHDPISGHVWPVAVSYVQEHYDRCYYDEVIGEWLLTPPS